MFFEVEYPKFALINITKNIISSKVGKITLSFNKTIMAFFTIDIIMENELRNCKLITNLNLKKAKHFLYKNRQFKKFSILKWFDNKCNTLSSF